MKAHIINSEKELKEALEVRRRVFVIEQKVDENLEYDEYDKLYACTHIGISANGRIIATARITPYIDTTCKYQRIAIDKEYRGKGLGKALINKLDEVALALGFTHVIIDAQVYAEKFYNKTGFSAINREIFMDAGIPHIRMEKTIA